MMFSSFQVVVGLALLIWGADRFVVGASAIARNFGISPVVIGLTIVAFATSAPELLVSAVASLHGNTGLAVGNAVGSNIANIGLVLGVLLLIKPIVSKPPGMQKELWLLLAVSIAAYLLLIDQQLGRIDGLLFVTTLLVMAFIVTRNAVKAARSPSVSSAEDIEEVAERTGMFAALSWLLVGLAALLIGAELLVNGSVSIARSLGVSEIVIGITLVAIGTSLPELAVSAVSALKGEQDLAIGNIIGSNVVNLLGVIGFAALIRPTALPSSVISLHLPVMLGFTAALLILERQQWLNRTTGLLLLTAFLAFNGAAVLTD